MSTPRSVFSSYATDNDLLPREAGELLRLGVRHRDLHEPTPVRAGNIQWEETGRFSLAADARPSLSGRIARAFIFLVEDEAGVPADVVAWQPGADDRVGSLFGIAWGLGQESALAPRLDVTLPVHRSPLGWLRSGRRGVVLLRPRLAADVLCDAEPLEAEDDRHGLELRHALTRRAPKILVRTSHWRAAA